MRGSIVTVQPTFLIALCEGATSVCLPSDCDFEITEARQGDQVEIDGIERDDRGQRATGIRWLSRPRTTSFVGTVEKIFADRGFGFAISDQGARIYLHEREFRDREDGRSATFASLRPGSRVQGEWCPTPKGPRGVALESER